MRGRVLNSPLNRCGGNNTSRYNWELNADNRGSDWYFESLGYASATPGEVGDTFVATGQSAGARPMLTVPMLGWVANLGPRSAKAQQLLDRPLRRADTKRLAVVPMPATASPRTGSRSSATIR